MSGCVKRGVICRPVSDSAPDAVFDGFALLHQAWDDLRAVPATD